MIDSNGAGWSYFMPWYGDYTMDGWAHDNTAADWNSILNNAYVLTLDKMPGWDHYAADLRGGAARADAENAAAFRTGPGWLELRAPGAGEAAMVSLYDLRGMRIAVLRAQGASASDTRRFAVEGVAPGIYQARAGSGNGDTFNARVVLSGR